MEKTKAFLSQNKKIMMVVSLIVVALVVFLVGFMFLSGNSREKELTQMLEDMGREFYEEYYYDGLNKTESEKEEFFKKYEKQGIKINLKNLSRYNSKVNEKKIKEFVNPKTNESCDLDSSMVYIYPKKVYGKKDYDIKVQLVCGFDDNEKEEKKN